MRLLFYIFIGSTSFGESIKKMGFSHLKFISRTVFVRNNDVDTACRQLNRILGREGIYDQYRRTRYFERPCQRRRRVNYEICKAIYDEDMKRKIEFTLRTNRHQPFPAMAD